MSAVEIRMVIMSVDTLLGNVRGSILRSFTRTELDYSLGFRNPLYPLAARFCAKRALQLWAFAEEGRLLKLDEVEVRGTPFGPPRLILRGDALRLAAARDMRALHLSLSHCQDYAGALLAVTTDRDREARCNGWSPRA